MNYHFFYIFCILIDLLFHLFSKKTIFEIIKSFSSVIEFCDINKFLHSSLKVTIYKLVSFIFSFWFSFSSSVSVSVSVFVSVSVSVFVSSSSTCVLSAVQEYEPSEFFIESPYEHTHLLLLVGDISLHYQDNFQRKYLP